MAESLIVKSPAEGGFTAAAEKLAVLADGEATGVPSPSFLSQAAPLPSLLASIWSGLATFGQLSIASGTPSPSLSGPRVAVAVGVSEETTVGVSVAEGSWVGVSVADGACVGVSVAAGCWVGVSVAGATVGVSVAIGSRVGVSVGGGGVSVGGGGGSWAI